MSQSFTPNTPATNAAALSAQVRDNDASLLSSNSGSAIPSYAVSGTLWFDTTVQRLKVAKQRGTDPFLAVPMGAQVNLFIDLASQIGRDGSDIALDVRVQDGTLISGDRSWTATGTPVSEVAVYFNIS